MEKKDTPLDKDNKTIYSGKTVYLGTKHGKEEVLGPLLLQAGLTCSVALVDTDRFGTFSGEVKREGTIKDALNKKIQAVFEKYPEAELALASEGSFGPHPMLPFGNANHEALLFVDKVNDLEIYVEELSHVTNLCEQSFSHSDLSGLDAFLDIMGFPFHAVMVKGVSDSSYFYKGIHSKTELDYIMEKLFSSGHHTLVLASDMRAFVNPTRMQTIANTGKKLKEALTTLCPKCEMPGFRQTGVEGGLECADCKRETYSHKHQLWSCSKCSHTELKGRADGVTEASPAECQYCNP